MNLAIASPKPPGYSETFVRMQMEQLPCVLRIHGEPIASETIPGGPIRWGKSLLGLRDVIAAALDSDQTPRHVLQARELKRRLLQHRTEIVMANYGRNGVGLLPLCRELSIPLVVHFHGYDAHRISEVNRLKNDYRELGRHCRAIIAVSETMRAALIDLGMPSEKIHLIRYGVDPEKFQPRPSLPETPLFFGIGRFVDKKAPYLAVLAFQQVWRKYPDAKLVLGGDGPLFETVKNLVAFHGMDSAVELPGVLAPEEVARWMRQATAYLQHSIVPRFGPSAGDSEGTPVAMLEAMMTGVPVIGTRHAGIGEVVQDGITGCIHEERDVGAMAAAMIRFIESPADAQRMGAEARRQALEKYTSARYLRELSTLLESCLSGASRQASEQPE